MKLTNEIKVAILAIVAIVLFIFGYNFLKGKNLFTASNIFYAEYAQVGGLTTSASVNINGFQVGIVTDLYLKEDGTGKIMAVLQLNRGVEIPTNTVASIYSVDPLSGKAIKLDYERPCGGPSPCAESGDTLNTAVIGMLAGMLGQDGMDQLNKATEMAKGMVDSLKTKFGGGDGQLQKDLKESFDDLRATLNNLNAASGKLDRLLGSSEPEIKALLANLNSLTGSIDAKKLDRILDNAEQMTANLKDIDLDKTLGKANTAIDSMQNTLTAANNAIGSLEGLLDNVSEGDGTLSKLINEDEIYIEALNALRDLDFLLKDFRLNPKRYVHVSVIGRKGKPYNGVEDDPEGRVDEEDLEKMEDKKEE